MKIPEKKMLEKVIREWGSRGKGIEIAEQKANRLESELDKVNSGIISLEGEKEVLQGIVDGLVVEVGELKKRVEALEK